MARVTDKDVKNILSKYSRRIERQMGEDDVAPMELTSREYEQFRREALQKTVTGYEQWCNTFEGILRVAPNKNKRDKLQKSIDLANLNITPEGATSFAVVIALLLIFIGLGIGALTYFFGELMLALPLLFIFGGALLIIPLSDLPNKIAAKWRLEVSNQMVLCILYVVMYMRHTSNLEHAIKFASEHVGPPLSFELKKIFWNVQTEKFFTIKESLDNYLENWKEHNIEFVESFHLIEGSLYEPTEKKRIAVLEKALQVMLDGTYEKMLHYAHNLQSPITILNMLGVVLPILGLVMFPLLGSFLSGLIKWYHLAILYNILLPIFVYALGNNLLSKRPTGYGQTDLLRINPEFKHYQNILVGEQETEINPFLPAFLITLLFVVVAFLPIIIYLVEPTFDMNILGGKLLDFKDGQGPYGLGAMLFSLLLPMGLAYGLAFYYRVQSKNLIEIKKKMDKLETEFSGSLFQFGNRVGDGMPTELAFQKVSSSMQGTPTGTFFQTVDQNIRKLGVDIKTAIFDPKFGAILAYPSKLIETSMKVLVQAAKKGPKVVSKSMITISRYTQQIKKVNERLRDLLADVLSSMSSQASFLTPLIAGIVVGVGSMIVTIINQLGEQFSQVNTLQEGQFGNLAAISSVLNIKDVIPGFQFQAIVGIYVVQVTIILTILATQIERGIDPITTKYRISKNLIRSTTLYILIAGLGIIIFNVLAQSVTAIGGVA